MTCFQLQSLADAFYTNIVGDETGVAAKKFRGATCATQENSAV